MAVRGRGPLVVQHAQTTEQLEVSRQVHSHTFLEASCSKKGVLEANHYQSSSSEVL